MVPVDRLFSENRLAAIYDACCTPGDVRGDFGFHLPLVMAAHAVLDVGCGTGDMLRRARVAGHRGRLVGIDPAEGMLNQARKVPDVEWLKGEVTTVNFETEFDLAVMTGHVFQVFLEDEDLRQMLEGVYRALKPGGRFSFETRNPAARDWEQWVDRDAASEVEGPDGVVRVLGSAPTVDGERVSFENTYLCDAWEALEHSHSTLRFLDADAVIAFIRQAGLSVEEMWGDFDRSPVSASSTEIVVVARR